MPDPSTIGPKPMEIRRADLDHWSDIRDLHAFSFRRLTGPHVDPAACAAYLARMREPEYTVALQAQDLLVAWIDRQLVGTAGWVPFDSRGLTARITSVCVSPLFTRLGVGRRLVEAAEERASQSGYGKFAARAFPPCVGFYEALDYARSSQGVQSLGNDSDLPIVFMRKNDIGPDELRRAPDAAVEARMLQRR